MIWEIIAGILPLALAAGAAYLKSKFTNQTKAISSIEAGVLHAWEEFGRVRKAELNKEFSDPQHSRQSPKFEPEDILKLKSLASNKATDVMANLGGKLLSDVINPELWGVEIEKAITRVKTK